MCAVTKYGGFNSYKLTDLGVHTDSPCIFFFLNLAKKMQKKHRKTVQKVFAVPAQKKHRTNRLQPAYAVKIL